MKGTLGQVKHYARQVKDLLAPNLRGGTSYHTPAFHPEFLGQGKYKDCLASPAHNGHMLLYPQAQSNGQIPFYYFQEI
jgi:hypothetical protein